MSVGVIQALVWACSNPVPALILGGTYFGLGSLASSPEDALHSALKVDSVDQLKERQYVRVEGVVKGSSFTLPLTGKTVCLAETCFSKKWVSGLDESPRYVVKYRSNPFTHQTESYTEIQLPSTPLNEIEEKITQVADFFLTFDSGEITECKVIDKDKVVIKGTTLPYYASSKIEPSMLARLPKRAKEICASLDDGSCYSQVKCNYIEAEEKITIIGEVFKDSAGKLYIG